MLLLVPWITCSLVPSPSSTFNFNAHTMRTEEGEHVVYIHAYIYSAGGAGHAQYSYIASRDFKDGYTHTCASKTHLRYTQRSTLHIHIKVWLNVNTHVDVLCKSSNILWKIAHRSLLEPLFIPGIHPLFKIISHLHTSRNVVHVICNGREH